MGGGHNFALKFVGPGGSQGLEGAGLDDPQQPAVVLTRDGFGNPANNGVRNAVVLDDALYFGTSSYTNLPPPEGQAGWELFSVRRDEVIGSEKEGDRE